MEQNILISARCQNRDDGVCGSHGVSQDKATPTGNHLGDYTDLRPWFRMEVVEGGRDTSLPPNGHVDL